jgi:hypothetical protein
MQALKSYLTHLYFFLKTTRKIKKLSEHSVDLPMSAQNIKNVLIILPLEEKFVDAAMTLIRHIRQYFNEWHFMILNLNKLNEGKLDRFGLPNQSFLKELAPNDFQLSVNLSFGRDLRSDYIITILKIPYRLHIYSASSDYYNMCAQLRRENFTSYHHVLESLKSSFIKEE